MLPSVLSRGVFAGRGRAEAREARYA